MSKSIQGSDLYACLRKKVNYICQLTHLHRSLPWMDFRPIWHAEFSLGRKQLAIDKELQFCMGSNFHPIHDPPFNLSIDLKCRYNTLLRYRPTGHIWIYCFCDFLGNALVGLKATCKHQLNTNQTEWSVWYQNGQTEINGKWQYNNGRKQNKK